MKWATLAAYRALEARLPTTEKVHDSGSPAGQRLTEEELCVCVCVGGLTDVGGLKCVCVLESTFRERHKSRRRGWRSKWRATTVVRCSTDFRVCGITCGWAVVISGWCHTPRAMLCQNSPKTKTESC